ncbi:MAG: Gfo/Idh/MocA family oxidoreductase, partial [Candidatus Nealsonbacteria bacterium]|nr:Gfo/Idh/MocA family oxidoreductase [Candidatus Nealsonbacteria bacterium]
MAYKASRRQFLKTTAVTGAGYWVAGGVRAQESKSPNEKIAFASVGIGGKGSSDSNDAGSRGDMVAICDVDTGRLDGAKKKFSKAKAFTDFRKMFDEMGKSIDAVTVSTPDHCHAAAALMAMRMGKHCFVQKPLTHSIYEARLMGKIAKEKGLATQMGNQGTAGGGLRKAAAMMKAGRLGTPKEVIVWSNRPIWPQGGPRPAAKEAPANLKWNEWLGPAPERPYGDGYHPFAWRGWWDFGTGALGDMACHTVNMPYMGLDLFNPTSVQAETDGHNKDSYPKWSIINFEFPAVDWRPAIKFTWMDGGKRPDPEVLEGDKPQGSGCIVIGTKGKLYSGNDYGGIDKLYGDVDDSDDGLEYDRSPGHFQEWVDAIKGGKPAKSDFADYAGGLTETILLGNLAVYVAAEGKGEKVEWDAKNLKVKNITG